MKNTNMKKNDKKHSIYFIYLRYLLPIFTPIIIFAMLFVPSYRFIFSDEVGDPMSCARLLSNSWYQVRNVLFGSTEQTNMATSFSTMLFALIIILVVLYLISIAISIWSAVVAFRYFLSENRESAEHSRRFLQVFIPNRIVLSIFTLLSLSISVLPYLMKPLYWFNYSQAVTVILEAPDSLIVGGVLVLATLVLSIACAPAERKQEIDVFAKDVEEDGAVENTDVQIEDKENIDDESKERIRRLFDNDDNDDKNKK